MLSATERQQSSGMTDRQRAVLHLWGGQMSTEGKNDGSILLNVMEDSKLPANQQKFKPAEHQLAFELSQRDQGVYGGITGKSLDQEFFQLYGDITGKDVSSRYANSPVLFCDGPADLSKKGSTANGLNGFSNSVLQLWGHSPLYNGGKIDGNIIEFSMNSPNKLEFYRNDQDKAEMARLLDADKKSDGVVNGDSLNNAMVDVLDNVYLGGPAATADKTMNDALGEASLRAQGLLPPAAEGVGKLDAIQLHGPRPGGGACPFFQNQPASPQQNQQSQGAQQAGGGYGGAPSATVQPQSVTLAPEAQDAPGYGSAPTATPASSGYGSTPTAVPPAPAPAPAPAAEDTPKPPVGY
jgi:hypothetical protein